MRLINLLASAQSPEGYNKTTERLIRDYGEPVITQRSGIIPMEHGAWDKLKRLRDNVG
jgi:hypothetical protein